MKQMNVRPLWLLCLVQLVRCISYEPVHGWYHGDALGLGSDCDIQCGTNKHLHPGTHNVTVTNEAIATLSEAQREALHRVYDGRFMFETVTWQLSSCEDCPLPLAPSGQTLPLDAFTLDSECGLTCRTDNLYFKRDDSYSCTFCNASTCSVGHYMTGNCQSCQPCTHQYPGESRWEFITNGQLDTPNSCVERCESGYFVDYVLQNDRVVGRCTAHTLITCQAGQYQQPGTHFADTQCLPCLTSCGPGFRMTQECSAYANAECEACNGTLQVHQEWGENCSPVCHEGFVLNTQSGVCEYCPSNQCPLGFKTASPRLYCTHCVACDVSIPMHAEYVDGAPCVWECVDGYESHYVRDLDLTICQPSTVAEVPLAAPVLRNPLRTCTATQFLNDDYECEECSNRGIITPSNAQLEVRWRWMYNCAWECLPTYYYFAESATLHFCYTWDEYKALVGLERAEITAVGVATETLPVQRRALPPQTLPATEWMVCGGIVAMTLLLLLARG